MGSRLTTDRGIHKLLNKMPFNLTFTCRISPASFFIDTIILILVVLKFVWGNLKRVDDESSQVPGPERNMPTAVQ